MMKTWRLFLTMIFCLCLGVGFGLGGCGDDDDEGGMTCAEALQQMLSPACQNAAYGGVGDLEACLTGCLGDGDCEDLCWDDWVDVAEPCVAGGETLEDRCGCSSCNDDFSDCILGVSPGSDCLDDVIDCFTDCVT